MVNNKPSALSQVAVSYYEAEMREQTPSTILDNVLDKTAEYYLDLYRYYQVLLMKVIIKSCKCWLATDTVSEGMLQQVTNLEDECDKLLSNKNSEFSMGCVTPDLLSYLLIVSGKTTSIGVHALLKLCKTKDDSGYFDVNQELGDLLKTKYDI